ncbi:MAG: nickel-dependent hydrogenase large subunit [Sulfuricurvum sp.]|jgi:quinone-reactive Ni/Fe-hydrogenase large subunit|uniref:nickel-dependent hydrogenase large subunit n=1 Tax=Sulfuricurvum sp. TaxID=2025608 RepID=UPI0025F6A3D7|nr:nickel-dependent hydrogenase large subunit [Sulfuricurvum sp.]MCK9374270.1 nickel-dependent hydrogenase large subunit [Sulfuricurvum sp.]
MSSKQKIVIDPVTRIEGHLRVEVEIDENNVVTEAWASGQLFRGIEIILKGRDPRDVGMIAQRICGVCTNVHYRASISAVEDAYAITIPQNAEIIRNLVTLALFVQDHMVHYYHLHSLDFVDITGALSADCIKAAEVAERYHDHPYRNSVGHLESVKEKLGSFVKAGRLGLFANGYWGHAAYRLSPEENLVHMNHYLEALRLQHDISKAIAIFAGKTPHPQNLVVGGVTSVADMLNPQRLNDFMFIIKETRDFIERAYIPDMKMIVNGYRESMEAGEGRGNGNFLCCGGYRFGGKEELFTGGVIRGHDFDSIDAFDPSFITEEASRSWYENDAPRSPYEEDTVPFYTDLNDDGTLKSEGKYSWVKAPRYQGKPMEVGPLARMIMGVSKNSKVIKPYMDRFMEATGMKLIDFSTSVGRNAARAVEAEICCDYIFDFISDLIENIKYYDESTWTKYSFEELPKEARGHGIFEVPRGVLGHFVRIEDSKVANYQAVVPTTWNASPKDADNRRGAYEESLIGLKLADPKNPLEVLRVIHSFDPCLACAVHVIDTKGREVAEYKIPAVCL